MSGRNDITGDRLINKTLSKEGEENWDRIFKKEDINLNKGSLTDVKSVGSVEIITKVLRSTLPEYELDKSTGEVIKKHENT
jgi:hypothetical protein